MLVVTPFDSLVSGIFQSPPWSDSSELSPTLVVAQTPDIFIAPPLRILTGNFDAAEVAFVQAPAAVGKSTLVRYLSSRFNAPILDLAKVAAGANTLSGSLNELNSEAPMQFRTGDLTVLVDALDEGLIRSGEWHLEEFLRTSALSIVGAERRPGRLRLILFGRIPAENVAKTSFEIYAPEISTISMEILFFDENAARNLVHERARAVTEVQPKQQYAQKRLAIDNVLTTYFSAIGASLSLPEGTLWKDEKGQAFAGYAPVLDTLGYSCAQHPNLAQLQSALDEQAFEQAWMVLRDGAQFSHC